MTILTDIVIFVGFGWEFLFQRIKKMIGCLQESAYLVGLAQPTFFFPSPQQPFWQQILQTKALAMTLKKVPFFLGRKEVKLMLLCMLANWTGCITWNTR